LDKDDINEVYAKQKIVVLFEDGKIEEIIDKHSFERSETTCDMNDIFE
jgi:hypothetical protein